MPLSYKIKYENKNKIIVDLSNGGFTGSKFEMNLLPVGKKFILEEFDSQGITSTSICYTSE